MYELVCRCDGDWKSTEKWKNQKNSIGLGLGLYKWEYEIHKMSEGFLKLCYSKCDVGSHSLGRWLKMLDLGLHLKISRIRICFSNTILTWFQYKVQDNTSKKKIKSRDLSLGSILMVRKLHFRLFLPFLNFIYSQEWESADQGYLKMFLYSFTQNLKM